MGAVQRALRVLKVLLAPLARPDLRALPALTPPLPDPRVLLELPVRRVLRVLLVPIHPFLVLRVLLELLALLDLLVRPVRRALRVLTGLLVLQVPLVLLVRLALRELTVTQAPRASSRSHMGQTRALPVLPVFLSSTGSVPLRPSTQTQTTSGR